MEVKNFLIDTESEDENIYETSFVSNPATGFGFLKFNKDEVKTLEFKQVQAEGYQRMVSGVWFMPDTKYLRYDKTNGIYTAEFKREALKAALLKYLKSDYANLIKVEHQGEYLEGFVSIEHWIYEDENTKSPIFGLTISDLGYSVDEIKPGTVLKTIYVEDEMFWNEQILSGNVKGFSISGLFGIEEETNAVKQYFNAVETVAEVVTEVAPVSPIVVEDTLAVVSADASVLDEKVDEVSVDSPSIEVITETPKQSTELSELSKKFDELSAKLENYISENSLLKEQLESKDKEIALNNSIIENQKNHLKDSPIKNTNPIKSPVTPIIKTNVPERTKKIGGYEISY